MTCFLTKNFNSRDFIIAGELLLDLKESYLFAATIPSATRRVPTNSFQGGMLNARIEPNIVVSAGTRKRYDVNSDAAVFASSPQKII